MQYNLPRHSDEFILTQLVELGKRYCSDYDNKWRVLVRFRSGDESNNDIKQTEIFGDKETDPRDAWSKNPLVKLVVESRGATAERFALKFSNNECFRIERKLDAPIDRASVVWVSNSQEQTPVGFRVAADAVRMLSTGNVDNTFGAVLGKELGNHVASRDAALARLEELLARFTTDLATYRQQTDDRLREGEAELRRRHEAAQEALRIEFAQKEEVFKEKEEAHQKRVAEIDDRDSLHARRELRKSMIKELEKRNQEFSLTAGTRKLRWPVALTLGIAGTILGGLLAYTIWMSATMFGDAKEWTIAMTYLAIKQSLLTAGFLSLVWYAVRWSNAWFREHADEEFKSKAMVLDIERASWVVETATDWKRANKTDMPDVLIARLTQDLFSSRNEVKQSAPDLSSALLGASSKIKLKLGENGEIELDRKGTQEIKKEMKNAN